MNKKAIFQFGVIWAFGALSHAQVGIGTNDPKSALDIVSTTSGILVPRMTAAEIEAIANPDEAELVYALTADGAVVNTVGFWFFYQGAWMPFTGGSVPAQNIYNADGVLTADRVINQNGNTLNIGPDLLYLGADSSNIGLNTNMPTAMLDVDGNMIVQNLGGVRNVVSDAQGVLMQDTAFFEYGDVKPSYRSADHDGWYLLDGRSISALPAAAQTNAGLIGIAGNLPDAGGKYSMGSTAATGTTSGNHTVAVAQANMPNVNFSYTAASAGGHSHNVVYSDTRINTPAVGGPNNIHVHWLGGTFYAGANYNNATTSVSHNHTYILNSGGSDVPLSIAPRAINFNYFVFLGE
jgi:hypothetical protein